MSNSVDHRRRDEGRRKDFRDTVPDQNFFSRYCRLPPPVKKLFDTFPLYTYPQNELPGSSDASRSQHLLYVFSTEQDARTGKPSYNPGCLKWQTYLKFRDVKHRCIASSNHASPTSALPFLLPASSDTSTQPPPVPSHLIQHWASKSQKPNDRSRETQGSSKKQQSEDQTDKGEQTPATDMRYDAYLSLVDHRIRNAYLYALYLSPSNFESIASPLYIQSATSTHLVRLALSYQLRQAAKAELLKHATVIDVEALYRECEKAFLALSALLGEKDYFFEDQSPSLFDASVFAYANVLLDETMQWQDRRLLEELRKHKNLVEHRERILHVYYKSRR